MKLRQAQKNRVKYLEQDGLEVLYTSPMVLMKDKKTGKHYVVDSGGTCWKAKNVSKF